MQTRMISLAFIGLCILSIPLLFISIYRVTEFGWDSVFYFQTIGTIALMILIFLRDRVALKTRSLLLVFIWFMVGAQGLWTLGLVGLGEILLLGSVLVATALLGIRWGVILAVISTSFLVIVLFSYQIGWIDYDFDINEYVRLLSVSLTTIGIFIMYMLLLIAYSIWSRNLLNSTLHSLTIRSQELRTANNIIHEKLDEQVEIQYELMLSEQRYRDLFHSVPVGVFQSTVQGNWIDVNIPLVTMLGYPNSDQLKERTLSDLFVDDHVYHRLLSNLETHKFVADYPAQLHHFNGTLIWVEFSARLMPDMNHQQFYEGIIRNITYQKSVEAHLKASQEQYRILFDNMLDGYMLCKVEVRKYEIINVNPAWEQLMRYSSDAVIGKSLESIFPDMAGKFTVFKAVMELGTTAEFESQFANNDRWFSITVFSHDADRLAFVFRDVTVRKEAEMKLNDYHAILETQVAVRTQELKEANERLIELGRAKDEFVSNVSHELRTPLTSFRLNLDMIERNPSGLPRYKAKLERETDRIQSMINGLLTLSRLEQSHHDMQYELLDLSTLLSDFVEDRHLMAEEKGLTLSLMGDAEGVQVEADFNLLEQVLSILVTNAVNYTPDGGVVMVGTITEDGWHGFYVKDTGPGISIEDQDRLFSRFFRGAAGRKSHASGTGLGLAIAKVIVERHHGKIVVESTGIAGEGTKFSILLPVKSE